MAVVVNLHTHCRRQPIIATILSAVAAASAAPTHAAALPPMPVGGSTC